MSLGASALLPFRGRQLIVPLALAATLTFAACGGGSSDSKTATSASQSSSTTEAAVSTAMPAAPTTAAEATTTEETTEAQATQAPATEAPTAEATVASTPEAAATSAGSGGDTTSLSALQDVAEAWSEATSYKITLSVYEADATSPTFVSTVERMAPDKQHTVTTLGGQSIETITIGEDTYTKIADTWQKAPDIDFPTGAPVDGADVVSDFTSPDTSAAGTKITKKDDETIDGVVMNVYELTDESGQEITFWVGKDDHLPRKSEIKMDTGRVEVIYSDYGKDFGIKAPI